MAGVGRQAVLVDDDVASARATARVLQRSGWEVRTAHSAREGLELLAAQHAELIVSDFCMPDEDGVTFLEQVAERWPQTVRVLYSGTVPDARIREAVARGVVLRHFAKGVDFEPLLRFVRDLAT